MSEELTAVQFINARLEELESQEYEDVVGNLCDIIRDVIKMHENWPVLVEGPMKIKTSFDDYDLSGQLNQMTYSMTAQIKWMTEQEYVKVFGTEPPTAPMIRSIANRWSDHPDFNESWRIK